MPIGRGSSVSAVMMGRVYLSGAQWICKYWSSM